MSDSLKKQANALENQFFQQVDQKLLDQLRKNMANLPQREALATIAHVKDPAVLDKLIELGLDVQTFAALTFVPLAAVAWADGNLDGAERRAILQAAEQHGIQPGKPGHQILEKWIEHPPTAELFAAWKAYIHALKAEVDATFFAKLKAETLEMAEKVADASGGILGLGERISPAEKRKLAELAKVFE